MALARFARRPRTLIEGTAAGGQRGLGLRWPAFGGKDQPEPLPGFGDAEVRGGEGSLSNGQRFAEHGVGLRGPASVGQDGAQRGERLRCARMAVGENRPVDRHRSPSR